MRRQNRSDGAPRELAVADLAAAGRAEPAGLANGERREIVVQQEGFLVGAGQRVDVLLVFAGAERGNDQRLSLAAGKQRRAVRARQDTDLGDDGTDRLQVASIDALLGIEN